MLVTCINLFIAIRNTITCGLKSECNRLESDLAMNLMIYCKTEAPVHSLQMRGLIGWNLQTEAHPFVV